jgi:hypothetical protein
LDNLPAGDYSYTVTDGMGCESLNAITIVEPQDSLMISFDVTSETCAGDLNGIVAATITGGTSPMLSSGIMDRLQRHYQILLQENILYLLQIKEVVH